MAFSVVDASWELIDPNPNIHELFTQFNQMFFYGQLNSVYVQWSPRMTLCAGTCKFSTRSRECSIQLSKPLLSYRPRKDLVETLLHEMIHAYLFVVDGNRERESHGPKFHEHMWRINHLTGAKISVYHSFHDEVNHFKTHWWKCNGPCQHRPPYFGIVKRSMNRAPGPNDFWYKDHQANCGGSFTKIKEPSPKKAVKRKKESQTSPESDENKMRRNKITNYFVPPASTSTASAAATSSQPIPETNDFEESVSIKKPVNEPEPFTGKGFVLGSIENSKGKPASNSSQRLPSSTPGSPGFKLGGSGSQQPPRRGEHPLLAKWRTNYKASNSVDSPAMPTSATGKYTATPKSSTETQGAGNGSGSSTFKIQSARSSTVTNSSAGIEVIDLD